MVEAFVCFVEMVIAMFPSVQWHIFEKIMKNIEGTLLVLTEKKEEKTAFGRKMLRTKGGQWLRGINCME